MTTALQLITGAARLIGVVRKSESLSADEAADGLVSINDMLSSWSNNGLLVPYRVWEGFSVSAAASYSIGSGQTINTARPIAIKAAFIRSGTFDYPMDPITDEQYEAIPDKSTTTPFPDYFSYDNGYPYGTIRLYPQMGSSGELHILSEKALTSFPSLSTAVDMPPGWNKALRYNLALDMAPEYGVQPDPLVVKGAMDSMGAIKIGIAKNRMMPLMDEPSRRINIYSGQ